MANEYLEDTAVYGDTRAKDSFWSGLLAPAKEAFSGASQRLSETISGKTTPGGYSSSTQEVGAGLFDILYTRVKSGSKASSDRAAERFRQTRFGKNFIDESTRLQVESFFRNPVYAIGALVLVIFIMSSIRK